mmetsp:Transcript_21400/g.61937  ORF Transcript_21400/g.61937 Transcript_21400/m.61937 type:complete len:213 (-) Transcript_21400:693-1331(-)
MVWRSLLTGMDVARLCVVSPGLEDEGVLLLEGSRVLNSSSSTCVLFNSILSSRSSLWPIPNFVTHCSTKGSTSKAPISWRRMLPRLTREMSSKVTRAWNTWCWEGGAVDAAGDSYSRSMLSACSAMRDRAFASSSPTAATARPWNASVRADWCLSSMLRLSTACIWFRAVCIWPVICASWAIGSFETCSSLATSSCPDSRAMSRGLFSKLFR